MAVQPLLVLQRHADDVLDELDEAQLAWLGPEPDVRVLVPLEAPEGYETPAQTFLYALTPKAIGWMQRRFCGSKCGVSSSTLQ